MVSLTKCYDINILKYCSTKCWKDVYTCKIFKTQGYRKIYLYIMIIPKKKILKYL